MSTEDRVLHEILKEILASNRRLEKYLDSFLQKQSLILEELKENQDQDQSIVLSQMSEYLKEPQAIIDFVVKDCTKQNERMMKQLATEFKKACLLFKPDIIGMKRPNYKITSSPEDPVYVNQSSSQTNPIYTENTSILIKYAQNALQQVYDTAYYRLGYLPNLGTSFASLNDSVIGTTVYPNVMSQTQTLKMSSTSASDKGTAPVGTGVQTVLIAGLGSDGNRLNEVVTLNGTNTVTTTNQFYQVDTFYSLTTGSSNAAVGTITISGNTDSTAYGVIQATNNAWRSGRFFADNNAAGYIDSWNVGSYQDAVRAQLRTTVQAGSFNSYQTRASVIIANTSTQLVFPVPIRIPKSTSALVRAISKATSGGTEVTTDFELHFVLE